MREYPLRCGAVLMLLLRAVTQDAMRDEKSHNAAYCLCYQDIDTPFLCYAVAATPSLRCHCRAYSAYYCLDAPIRRDCRLLPYLIWLKDKAMLLRYA